MQSTNKTVLVTGATGGIGAVLCRQLAAQGVQLVLTCIDATALTALQAELGPRHHSVVADVSTAAGRLALVQTCAGLGGIDALINLAGILNFSFLDNQNPALVEKMLQINTMAPILLTQLLLPQLLSKQEARIINVGSIFASIGHPGFAVYCASKAAIKMFSEALARELADSPVTVAYIAPRSTRTALNNDKVRALNVALGNKEDPPQLVASEICRLLASNKRQRFLGWPEKLFVLVNAIMPAVVHKALVGKLAVIRNFARQ